MTATNLSMHSISSRALPNHCALAEFDVTSPEISVFLAARLCRAPHRSATGTGQDQSKP
jgi:hypothetical protein